MTKEQTDFVRIYISSAYPFFGLCARLPEGLLMDKKFFRTLPTPTLNSFEQALMTKEGISLDFLLHLNENQLKIIKAGELFVKDHKELSDIALLLKTTVEDVDNILRNELKYLHKVMYMGVIRDQDRLLRLLEQE